MTIMDERLAQIGYRARAVAEGLPTSWDELEVAERADACRFATALRENPEEVYPKTVTEQWVEQIVREFYQMPTVHFDPKEAPAVNPFPVVDPLVEPPAPVENVGE